MTLLHQLQGYNTSSHPNKRSNSHIEFQVVFHVKWSGPIAHTKAQNGRVITALTLESPLLRDVVGESSLRGRSGLQRLVGHADLSWWPPVQKAQISHRWHQTVGFQDQTRHSKKTCTHWEQSRWFEWPLWRLPVLRLVRRTTNQDHNSPHSSECESGLGSFAFTALLMFRYAKLSYIVNSCQYWKVY